LDPSHEIPCALVGASNFSNPLIEEVALGLLAGLAEKFPVIG
jgi:hypothetical protein